MSVLESIIWHILGYTAMPLILLTGFVAVSAISIWLLALTVDKKSSDN